MVNRETTYYSLANREYLAYIEKTADTLPPRAFINLGFDKKWYGHLLIPENNEFFLNNVGYIEDLKKLDSFLGEQLKLYARKKERDSDKYYERTIYEARKDWLKHTIFICKNEYNKTKKEVFKEVVKWCKDWQKNWLETFNPSIHLAEDRNFDNSRLLPNYENNLSKIDSRYFDVTNGKEFFARNILTDNMESSDSTDSPKSMFNIKLPLIQVALLFIYNDKRITNTNKNEIAKLYGHKSGHKLIQLYNKHIKSTDRIGDPGSHRMLKHKIRMLEDVVEMLTGVSKEQAEKDLHQLITLYKNNYQ